MLKINYRSKEYNLLIQYVNQFLTLKKNRPTIDSLLLKINSKLEFSEKYSEPIFLDKRKHLYENIKLDASKFSKIKHNSNMTIDDLIELHNFLIPKGVKKIEKL